MGGAAASAPRLIYSARELLRSASEPGPFHNFPRTFDSHIIQNGVQTVAKGNYIQFDLAGTANGRNGVYQIGLRVTQKGLVVVHRFFKPSR